jgi:hypothetical protein
MNVVSWSRPVIQAPAHTLVWWSSLDGLCFSAEAVQLIHGALFRVKERIHERVGEGLRQRKFGAVRRWEENREPGTCLSLNRVTDIKQVEGSKK